MSGSIRVREGSLQSLRIGACRVRSLLTGGVLCGAVQGGLRGIHTPPGGFEEELPPSFGRGGKGQPSNINRLAAKRKVLRLRKGRRKLEREAAAAAAAFTKKVEVDLQHLIKRNAAFTGRRHPPAERIRIVGDRSAEEAFFHDRIAGHFDRADAVKVASRVGSAEWKAADDDREPISNTQRTVLDEAVRRANTEEATDLGEVMREATQRADVFPLSMERSAHGDPTVVAPLPVEEDSWRREQALERRFAVTPGSTIFGSDLDRLERDMLREYDQRGASLPAMDKVYSRFGACRQGKRMQWEPSSSFDRMAHSDFDRNRLREGILGDEQNHNLSAYHMSAEAYRDRCFHAAHAELGREAKAFASGKKGVNLVKHRKVTEEAPAAAPGEDEAEGKRRVTDNSTAAATEGDMPASANPHFPASASAEDERSSDFFVGAHDAYVVDSSAARSGMEGRVVVVDARTDYRADLTTVHGEEEDFPYDAYNQRPAEEGLVRLRGADYWNDHNHRRDIEARAQYRKDRFEMEKLTEGALDTSEVEHSTNRVRRETFLYFQHYPINEMIQESFVRIREIVPKGGGEKVVLNRVEPHDLSTVQSPEERAALDKLNADVDIPLQEARRLAQGLGLDLIRVGAITSQKSGRRVVALCQIGDHREHLRDMIRFKIQKAGVQPPPTRECIEVPFRGGTHPHAIRFKAVGTAKHLLHRHAIRVNLTKFGTPREGFAVFQTILDEIKRQCLQLKAYHKAGEIQANYDEIYCYLYPSTGRSPKTTVDHPSPQMVREARDFRVLENEKEVYFDDLHNQITQKERLAYLTKLENGTAWADKDEGMSLQRQRAIKVMLGYLPKGNKELYAARGDVNIPAPFRTSHMTSTERWGNPVESNLEQASRGAATLGKRAAMPISEMHDQGETPENPTQLDRFYYRVQGPALEVGEFKEALGLKNNRKKRPPLASGFGTLGVGAHSGFERGTAAK